MILCHNRVDGGFGPYTTDGVHVLTSCFDDTILLPLISWVFIILTIILFLLHRGRHMGTKYLNGRDVEMAPVASISDAPNTTSSRFNRWSGNWRKTRISLLILATFLLVALFAMHALEIARLAADHQGVGLLPFCFIPLIVVLVSLYLPSPAWSQGGFARPVRPHGLGWMGLVSFWALWMVATVIVKLWSFSSVKKHIGEAAYNGKDSKYPYSDRIVDNVVICVVYFAFLLCYLHEMFFHYRRIDRRAFS